MAPNRLQVQYVVNNYDHVNSMARYNGLLFHELQQSADVEASAMVVGQALLPPALNSLIGRAGLNVNAFFKTYPLTWTARPQGIVHLTNRTLATLLLRKPNVPVVVTVHDIIHYQYRHQSDMHTYRHGMQAFVDEQSIFALRKADAILASSEYTRQSLIDVLGISPDRVYTVYLGVDTERFQQQLIDELFYNRYGLSPETRYILHVSTEEPRKDVAGLVRAFAKVRQQHPDVKLLKIGQPFYAEVRTRLLALIDELGLRESVIFIDNISDDDLIRFYNIAHCSALPSLAEGFGFPVLESMACGTPVVCSTGGSLAEICGDAALAVAPRDVDGLASAFGVLLNESHANREDRRQRGLAHARTFTWQRTAQQTVAVYKKAVEHANA